MYVTRRLISHWTGVQLLLNSNRGNGDGCKTDHSSHENIIGFGLKNNKVW
jgi:hypothetical protein